MQVGPSLVDGCPLATPHRSSATTAVVFHMHTGETGPIYHQRQTGTERSDEAACVGGEVCAVCVFDSLFLHFFSVLLLCCCLVENKDVQ